MKEPWKIHMRFIWMFHMKSHHEMVIWISWEFNISFQLWWEPLNIHMNFIKISWEFFLWKVDENIQMNCSYQFHMNFMISFRSRGFMNYSYEFHKKVSYEILMNISKWTVHINFIWISCSHSDMEVSWNIHMNFIITFIMKSWWKYPNKQFTLISYEFHDLISIERSYGIFIWFSYEFHKNFPYEILMNVSKWTVHINFIWISWSHFDREFSA